MNKEEAMDAINDLETYTVSDFMGKGTHVLKYSVLDIVSKIDKPQKVLVPKFVADWIELVRKNDGSLIDLFDFSESAYDELSYKVSCYAEEENGEDVLARAWLFGYEVEQEQLYTVEIPNPNRKSFLYALHRKDDGKIIIVVAADNYEEIEGYHLTESEIKEDFAWAWDAGFAKEVTDGKVD